MIDHRNGIKRLNIMLNDIFDKSYAYNEPLAVFISVKHETYNDTILASNRLSSTQNSIRHIVRGPYMIDHAYQCISI